MKKIYPLLLVALLSLAGSPVLQAQCTPSAVPYFVGFAGITANNQLPPCWAASSLGSGCLTFTIPNAAAFSSTAASSNYFYSPALTLSAGITYSAATFFALSASGNNWSSMSLLLGTSQASTGLVNIVTAVPSTTFYSPLSNTFAVGTSGTYYIAVNAVSTSSTGAQLLYWDDFSVIIPCNIAANQPSLTLSPSTATVCSGDTYTFTATGPDTFTWSTGANTSTISINPMANTLMSVTGGSTLTGCTATATATLTVKPSPNVMAIANPPAICIGKSSVIYMAGGSTYTWGGPPISGNTVVVSPTVTTTYTMTAIGGNSCSSTTSLTINVNPNPTVTATAVPTLVCKLTGSVTLIGSGAVNYSWSPSTTMPQFTTIYTLTGTDANGCTDIDTVVVKVAICAGLTDHAHATARLFPSPCSDRLFFQTDGVFVGRIRIMNTTGAVVTDHWIDADAASVDVSGLTPGMYFLQWEDAIGLGIERFIKE